MAIKSPSALVILAKSRFGKWLVCKAGGEEERDDDLLDDVNESTRVWSQVLYPLWNG